jgi:hypothetical protein
LIGSQRLNLRDGWGPQLPWSSKGQPVRKMNVIPNKTNAREPDLSSKRHLVNAYREQCVYFERITHGNDRSDPFTAICKTF